MIVLVVYWTRKTIEYVVHCAAALSVSLCCAGAIKGVLGKYSLAF